MKALSVENTGFMRRDPLLELTLYRGKKKLAQIPGKISRYTISGFLKIEPLMEFERGLSRVVN